MTKSFLRKCNVCSVEFISSNSTNRVCELCHSHIRSEGYARYGYCKKHKVSVPITGQRTKYCQQCLSEEDRKCVICGSILLNNNQTTKTCSAKCGFISGNEQRIKTNLEKYGTEYTLGNENIRNKGLETIRLKYEDQSIINIGQVQVVKDKIDERKRHHSSYTHKHYKCTRNMEWILQGFEKQSLEFLYSLNFKHISNRGIKFNYIHLGKNRRYYPDFKVDDDIIVEVKSEYYWFKDVIVNTLKADAAVRSGYFYLLLIWDKKGKKYTMYFHDDPTKPLVVTKTGRFAGTISQSITTNTEQTTVTRV